MAVIVASTTNAHALGRKAARAREMISDAKMDVEKGAFRHSSKGGEANRLIKEADSAFQLGMDAFRSLNDSTAYRSFNIAIKLIQQFNQLRNQVMEEKRNAPFVDRNQREAERRARQLARSGRLGQPAIPNKGGKQKKGN